MLTPLLGETDEASLVRFRPLRQLSGPVSGDSAQTVVRRPAGIALKNRNDPIDRPALDELRDSLQIAVAAADEAHVVHIAVDDVEIDLPRARAARIECMHAIPPWNFS